MGKILTVALIFGMSSVVVTAVVRQKSLDTQQKDQDTCQMAIENVKRAIETQKVAWYSDLRTTLDRRDLTDIALLTAIQACTK